MFMAQRRTRMLTTHPISSLVDILVEGGVMIYEAGKYMIEGCKGL